jgi:hypothetical protein
VTSIFHAALGADFARLHPKLQWRFGFASDDGVCQLGNGVMHEVWRGPWWTLPFLLLGSTRRVLFPSRGREVPFVIANYAYVDLHCSVDDDGALRMRSGEQRLHEGRVGFRFPRLVSGVADVREWWDEPTQALPHRRRRAQPLFRQVVRLPRVVHCHPAPVPAGGCPRRRATDP